MVTLVAHFLVVEWVRLTLLKHIEKITYYVGERFKDYFLIHDFEADFH